MRQRESLGLWDDLFHETVITFKEVYVTHFKKGGAGRKESVTKTVRMMLKVQIFQTAVLQNLKSSFTRSTLPALQDSGCQIYTSLIGKI